jgi:hypothetical protein
LLTVYALSSGAWAEDAERAAVGAAESWLALVDDGAYERSWDEAAEYFKGAIAKGDWQKAVRAARAPLGDPISRRLESATYTTSLPGAPDGEYVVIQYATSFTNKRSSVETITPMKDADGTWRVSGYYIK